jgi:hypothetical protein
MSQTIANPAGVRIPALTRDNANEPLKQNSPPTENLYFHVTLRPPYSPKTDDLPQPAGDLRVSGALRCWGCNLDEPM